MDLDVLGFGGFCDEDVGEEDGQGEEHDDDDHALLQPTLGLAHPGNAAVLSFLRVHGGTIMMMVVMRHIFHFFFSFKDNFSITPLGYAAFTKRSD